ncbi:MDIS1-interacting receptor like kinase 2-like [Salvia hispanica]|uniref:MDIS1-interacting receptor like kinase 2-like n=1 Tax=Salvia hispanica TaxID=49212 RepID=UPI002009A4F2|nr:MDIS1-interacting receptor like kinase 2-like [Salvia hispanica]
METAYLFPTYLSLLTLCLCPSRAATSEAEALMRWKSSLSSSASLKSWSVNNISNHCRWIGIHCNDEGSISGVDLPFADLAGTLDLFHFTALLNLTTFNLIGNYLNGSVPAAIGNLTSLIHLDLSNNQFSCAIPPEIVRLIKLRFLSSFSDNESSGELPSEIGLLTGLKYLYLSNNSFSGSIPPEIGNLQNLMGLDLSTNNFSGPIPSTIGNLTNMWSLDISSNKQNGPIHPPLGILQIWSTYISLPTN